MPPLAANLASESAEHVHAWIETCHLVHVRGRLTRTIVIGLDQQLLPLVQIRRANCTGQTAVIVAHEVRNRKDQVLDAIRPVVNSLVSGLLAGDLQDVFLNDVG